MRFFYLRSWSIIIVSSFSLFGFSISAAAHKNQKPHREFIYSINIFIIIYSFFCFSLIVWFVSFISHCWCIWWYFLWGCNWTETKNKKKQYKLVAKQIKSRKRANPMHKLKNTEYGTHKTGLCLTAKTEQSFFLQQHFCFVLRTLPERILKAKIKGKNKWNFFSLWPFLTILKFWLLFCGMFLSLQLNVFFMMCSCCIRLLAFD